MANANKNKKTKTQTQIALDKERKGTVEKRRANKLIYAQAAQKAKVEVKEVEEVMQFTAKYIVNVIKEGNLDSVRLPYFGVFRPRIDKLKERVEYSILPKEIQEEIFGRPYYKNQEKHKKGFKW